MSVQLGGLIPSRLKVNLPPEQEKICCSFLVKLTEQSLKAFIDREREKFDALVGDTGCHKRAIEVVAMARDPKMVEEIGSVLKCVQERGLETELSTRVHFLLLSYMLTLSKRLYPETNKEETDKKKLKEIEPKLANKKCSYFVRAAKTTLGRLSTEFLQRAEVNASLREKLVVKLCHFGAQLEPIPVMPCFHEVKSVLHRSSTLLLIVRLQTTLSPTSEVGRLRLFYREGKRIEAEPGPVLAFEGYTVRADHTVVVEELDDCDLEEVLLINCAQHPQFAGRERHDPVDDEELKQLASLAVERGCGMKNPTLFAIDHIFATCIDK